MDPAHPGEQGSGSLCNQIGRGAARSAHGVCDMSLVLALFVREAMTYLEIGSEGRLHLRAFRWQHINSVWTEKTSGTKEIEFLHRPSASQPD